MAVGSPVTNKYQIGTAELRIGPLSKAGMLTQEHSVGLVDQVTVNVAQETTELMGGFPQKLMDTAIVSQSMTISGTLREYSQRNMRALLGEGVRDEGATATPITTQLAESASKDSTEITVEQEGAGFKEGDLIVIYPTGTPEHLSICKVKAVVTDGDSTAVELDDNLPILFDYAKGAQVYTHEPIAIGAVTNTNYLAVQVIQTDNATGSPKIFQSWKASVASGMEYATSTTDFGSTELELSCLEPSAEEYSEGGPLAHLADIIPIYPTGMFVPGA